MEFRMLKQLLSVMALAVTTTVAQAKCQPNKIETDINTIRLDDEQSVERALGKLQALPIGANDKGPEINDFPVLVIYNRNKSEQAVLTQYPGTTAGDFAIIKVQKARKSLVGVTIQADRLSTERGIKLGVSEKFVSDLLGKCYSRNKSNPNEITIEYSIDDPAHPFLKRTGMPNYFGRYRFYKGKLISFELGSDYP
jgi:hypothetical protein